MTLLPKIDLPTYSITLPISKIEIKFRPYLVKEQKLLSMAKQAEDKNALVDAIKQILINCTVNSVDVSELPITDSEYYFYNLRARSESEIVKLKYRCESNINGDTCNNIMEYDLNLLTELEVFVPDVPDTIQINDDVGIKLKHQKFEKDPLKNVEVPSPEQLFKLIASNIDVIFDIIKDKHFEKYLRHIFDFFNYEYEYKHKLKKGINKTFFILLGFCSSFLSWSIVNFSFKYFLNFLIEFPSLFISIKGKSKDKSQVEKESPTSWPPSKTPKMMDAIVKPSIHPLAWTNLSVGSISVISPYLAGA